jgi:hypothetical protein
LYRSALGTAGRLAVGAVRRGARIVNRTRYDSLEADALELPSVSLIT